MAISYDPHMSNAANQFLGESPRVFGTIATRRVLVPNYAPFYSEDLEVRQGAKVLKEFKDYLVGYTFAAGILRTRRRLHGAVWIINEDLPGPFQLDYRSLGMATVSTEKLTAHFATAQKQPVECYWDDLVNGVYVPPADIVFDRENWRGEKELMVAIGEVSDALAARDPNDNPPSAVGLLQHYIDVVRNTHQSAPAIAHITQRIGNVHGDTPSAHGAIPLNTTASDSAKLNGRTEAQLTTEINSGLVTAANLIGKLHRDGTGDGISGSFVMRGGVSHVVAETTDDNSTLGLDPNMFLLSTKLGNLSITAPGGMRWVAGSNVLELYPDARGLRWNGKELLTPTTVGPYLPGGTAGGGVVFYGQSTPTVDITGNGVVGAPFVCTWKPQDPAVLNAPAMRQLTDDYGTSQTLCASTKLLLKLSTSFTGKLNRADTAVNGEQLAGGLMLSKSSIKLDKVDDIPDADLPVSTAQREELNHYASAGHGHNYSIFGIGAATTEKDGLILLAGPENTVTKALDGAAAVELLARTADLQSATGNGSAGLSVNATIVGAPDQPVIDITPVGWMFTMPAIEYYVRKTYPVPAKTFNLVELYPDTYQDMDAYIYIDIAGGNAAYSISDVRLSETATRTEVAAVAGNDTGASLIHVTQFTTLKGNSELLAHAVAPAPHITPAFPVGLVATNQPAGLMDLAAVTAVMPSFGYLDSRRLHRDWVLSDANGGLSLANVVLESDGFTLPAAGKPWLLRNLGMVHRDGTEANRVFQCKVSVVSGVTSVIEIPFGIVRSKGKWCRLSLLITAGAGFVDAVSGNSVIFACAYNYGATDEVIVPLVGSPETSGGWTWDVLGEVSVSATHAKIAGTQTCKHAMTVSIPTRFTAPFTLEFSGTSIVLSFGGNTYVTVVPQVNPAVTTSTAVNMLAVGVGGKFTAAARVVIPDFVTPVPLAPSLAQAVLEFPAYLDQTNQLDRCLFIDEAIPDADLGLTYQQHRAALGAKIAPPGVSGVCPFVDVSKMMVTVDTTNRRRQAVYIRE